MSLSFTYADKLSYLQSSCPKCLFETHAKLNPSIETVSMTTAAATQRTSRLPPGLATPLALTWRSTRVTSSESAAGSAEGHHQVLDLELTDFSTNFFGSRKRYYQNLLREKATFLGQLPVASFRTGHK